jgi:hypothetical protein
MCCLCAGGKRVLASWFCCGNAWGPCAATGTGACGTCHSGNNQCAWPNISDACKNITQPQNCGENPSRFGCGTAITVTVCCTLRSVTVTIADCGPRTKDFCGESKLCCYDPSRPPYFFYAGNRLIDLTPAAFSALANLDAGIIPVGLNRW